MLYYYVADYFLTLLSAKKNRFFSIFLLRAHLAYKMNPMKIYSECLKLNTVQISFCKVAVALIKFAIKDVNMTKKNVRTWLPYPY